MPQQLPVFSLEFDDHPMVDVSDTIASGARMTAPGLNAAGNAGNDGNDVLLADPSLAQLSSPSLSLSSSSALSWPTNSVMWELQMQAQAQQSGTPQSGTPPSPVPPLALFHAQQQQPDAMVLSPQSIMAAEHQLIILQHQQQRQMERLKQKQMQQQHEFAQHCANAVAAAAAAEATRLHHPAPTTDDILANDGDYDDGDAPLRHQLLEAAGMLPMQDKARPSIELAAAAIAAFEAAASIEASMETATEETAMETTEDLGCQTQPHQPHQPSPLQQLSAVRNSSKANRRHTLGALVAAAAQETAVAEAAAAAAAAAAAVPTAPAFPLTREWASAPNLLAGMGSGRCASSPASSCDEMCTSSPLASPRVARRSRGATTCGHGTATGSKPKPMYACKYCAKPFSDRANRRRHERKHEGSTPFTCKYCGKGFSHYSNGKAHQKTHEKDLGLRDRAGTF